MSHEVLSPFLCKGYAIAALNSDGIDSVIIKWLNNLVSIGASVAAQCLMTLTGIPDIPLELDESNNSIPFSISISKIALSEYTLEFILFSLFNMTLIE